MWQACISKQEYAVRVWPRWWPGLVAVLVLCLGGVGSAAEPAAYVDAMRWARDAGFQVRWLAPSRVVVFSRRGCEIELINDSACIRVNGVRVWLSYAVRMRQGSVRVSESDLDSVLRPLTRVPQLRAVPVRVVLDPGHGGKDLGYHSGSYVEKKYTLLLAREVRKYLEAAGFTVTLTRAADRALPLTVRAELANRTGADVFVSLHFNAAEVSPGTVDGVEVYSLTPVGARSTNSRRAGPDRGTAPGLRHTAASIVLAYMIQSNLVWRIGTTDRGTRFANFEVLRAADMPAVLVEAGFLSHPAERRKIADPAYRTKLAAAIADGIIAYRDAVRARTVPSR